MEDGRIRKAKVYSDSINVELISRLNELLNTGRMPYDFGGIDEIGRELKASLKDSESQKQVQ